MLLPLHPDATKRPPISGAFSRCPQGAGNLPADDPAVCELVFAVETVRDVPERFGLTESLAVHEVHSRSGHECNHHLPTYANLTPPQRRLMNDAEPQVRATLASYMVFDSRFWPVIVRFLALREVAVRLARKQARPRGPFGVSRQELGRSGSARARRW